MLGMIMVCAGLHVRATYTWFSIYWNCRLSNALMYMLGMTVLCVAQRKKVTYT
jgi:hypothetical protein